MKTLDEKTANEIRYELENIPEKFQSDFNSIHEGYGVLMEEVKELEDEIFFGQKRAVLKLKQTNPESSLAKDWHKKQMRKEAIQVACMAIRFIQELT